MTNEQKATATSKLKVELHGKDWDVILDVINQSNSPHLTVEKIKTVLIGQLNPQLEKQQKDKS
jgi:hypothetical protein